MRSREARSGLTLVELLIASVILVIIAGPMGVLLWQSNQGVRSADRAREARSVIEQLLLHVESTDFVTLYKNFGWGLQPEVGQVPESPDAMRTSLVTAGHDPLCLGESLVGDLERGRWKATLQFRFLTKTEVEQIDRVKSRSGILHLQAGVICLTLTGENPRDPQEEIRQILYCPMILGRPGLLLKQCPAVNPALRDGQFGSYP